VVLTQQDWLKGEIQSYKHEVTVHACSMRAPHQHEDQSEDGSTHGGETFRGPTLTSCMRNAPQVAAIVEEYFSSGDVGEVAASLDDLGAPDFMHYLVKRVIILALDRKDREREMTSVLLSSLYAEVRLPVFSLYPLSSSQTPSHDPSPDPFPNLSPYPHPPAPRRSFRPSRCSKALTQSSTRWTTPP
jgi:hypothetical protein